MRDLVGCGRSRPIAWRQTQLKQLRSLVMSHEQEVITALASDLGKPPTEAFFEVVALLQELNPGLFDAIGDAVGAMGSAVSTTVDEAASSLFQAVGGIFTWS